MALLGASDDDDRPARNGVVWINGCTGSLVAPDIVLTSGHCFDNPRPPYTPGTWGAMDQVVIVGIGNDSRRFRVRIQASQANRPPGAADMVLFKLDRTVDPGDATPIKALMRDPLNANCPAPNFWQGQSLRMAGWGLIEGGSVTPVRRTRGVSGAVYPDRDRNVASNPQYISFGPAIVQSGDSGSPLLWTDPLTGIEYVIGVCQGTASTKPEFGGLNSYVATFAPWGIDANGIELPNLGRWLETALGRPPTSPAPRKCALDVVTYPSNPTPLWTYWSAERGDHFATATPMGRGDARTAGYERLRSSAVSVLSTQEPGTVPLKLFWNPARGDNFTTATHEGERSAIAAGYQFVRIEGYVYETEMSGTVPIVSHWNAELSDNATTTEPPTRAGYRRVRIEGFALDQTSMHRDPQTVLELDTKRQLHDHEHRRRIIGHHRGIHGGQDRRPRARPATCRGRDRSSSSGARPVGTTSPPRRLRGRTVHGPPGTSSSATRAGSTSIRWRAPGH